MFETLSFLIVELLNFLVLEFHIRRLNSGILQWNRFQHRSLLFHSIYSTISFSTPVVANSFNLFNDIILNTGRCYFIQFFQRYHFQHRSLLFQSISSTKSFSTPVVAISFNFFNEIIFNTGRCYFIQFLQRNHFQHRSLLFHSIYLTI